jgi:aryl-alcohol dehydrogenase-like predicted oxidoreductase
MKQGFGVSEEIIGNWLRHDPARRDQVVLATKLYQPMGLGPNDRHLSAYHIRRACEASLRRLQTDHIDLYQMHHVDRSTPWEEIWQAMDQLVTSGKVTYIGSSNFAGWHIATAQSVATGLGQLGLVSEQSRYNLTARAIEAELIPALRHFGVGLIPYGPVGGGLLAGVLDQPREGRRAALTEQIEQQRAQIEAYEDLCRELGEQPADVAVAWVLANPVVSAAIVGPRTANQLDASLRATDVTLGTDVVARLDEIWPGPGGEAPESYAW